MMSLSPRFATVTGDSRPGSQPVRRTDSETRLGSPISSHGTQVRATQVRRP